MPLFKDIYVLCVSIILGVRYNTYNQFKLIYLQTNIIINLQYRNIYTYIQAQWNYDENRGFEGHSPYK